MIVETPVVFHSHGIPLVGRIMRNTASFHERQSGVIVMGSWLTVKEQMDTSAVSRNVTPMSIAR